MVISLGWRFRARNSTGIVSSLFYMLLSASTLGRLTLSSLLGSDLITHPPQSINRYLVPSLAGSHLHRLQRTSVFCGTLSGTWISKVRSRSGPPKIRHLAQTSSNGYYDYRWLTQLFYSSVPFVSPWGIWTLMALCQSKTASCICPPVPSTAWSGSSSIPTLF